MPEIIAGVLISFFAIIGFVEFVDAVFKCLLTPRLEKIAFVVTCRGHDEQIEYCVRSLASQSQLLRFRAQPLIIVLDAGMDEETRLICEKLACDFDGVSVCKSNELPLILNGELQN
jgi:hypothetical protein